MKHEACNSSGYTWHVFRAQLFAWFAVTSWENIHSEWRCHCRISAEYAWCFSSQHQFWTSVKCMWHTTFFNLLLFGGDAVRVCLPLTTTSNTPRHQALRQTMGYHNPNKWGGVSPNKLTSQPDILLMAQVPPNNTQQCSAAHFGRQSSILSWRRVWHGQHARFCFFPLFCHADCERQTASRKVTSNTSRLVPLQYGLTTTTI